MRLMHLLALVMGSTSAWAVQAADDAMQRPQSGVVSSADVLQWVTGLIVVLAIFGLFVWLLRKTGNFSVESKNQLAVLSGLSLGMREKLVLVKVGDKQLLLGVTPGRVDKLLELEGDDRLFQDRADKADAGLFAKKLRQVLQGKNDA